MTNQIVADPRPPDVTRVVDALRQAVIPALLVGTAMLASSIVLVQARFLTFYGDEWNLLIGHPGLLTPNNEHWSTGLYVVYYGLLATAGGRSYLPFVLVLLLAHWIAAAGIFTLLRPRVGVAIASVVTALLLSLGSASQDFYWAWQVGFVGSVAFGAWAFVALERQRQAWAAVLLVGGLATSGVGLFFLAAALTYTFLERAGRRWSAAALLVYLTWFVPFGLPVLGSIGHPFSVSTVLAVPLFVGAGLSSATGAISGLGPLGLGVAVLLVGYAVTRSRDPLPIAMVLALIVEYALVGLVRIGTGPTWTTDRYIYPAAVFLLVPIAMAAKRVGRGPHQLALAGLASVALAVNVVLLVRGPIDQRLRLPEAYGCPPATIPAALSGWDDVVVPSQLRC
jgi:hypothetical protein